VAEYIGKNTTARMEFEILYGPVDREPTRIMKMEVVIAVSLKAGDNGGTLDTIVSESDAPYFT
jgi:hypothetical protein